MSVSNWSEERRGAELEDGESPPERKWSRRSILTLGVGGVAALVAAGALGVDLVSHGVLPGQQELDQRFPEVKTYNRLTSFAMEYEQSGFLTRKHVFLEKAAKTMSMSDANLLIGAVLLMIADMGKMILHTYVVDGAEHQVTL